MIRRHTLALCIALTALWLTGTNTRALNLPHIFSDNMVLQRDLPIKVWGWADPGQEVAVSFAGQKQTTKADAAGKWQVTAKAEAVGNTVVVSSDQIATPVAVRFGWRETAEPNLGNGAGLPASPFRTDAW